MSCINEMIDPLLDMKKNSDDKTEQSMLFRNIIAITAMQLFTKERLKDFNVSLALENGIQHEFDSIANDSYLLADSMIKARDEREEKKCESPNIEPKNSEAWVVKPNRTGALIIGWYHNARWYRNWGYTKIIKSKVLPLKRIGTFEEIYE